ncbi:MAG: flagellar hook-length control protein FliK [Deltaproteobacteria bacterium]|nr:flagellar hook-length control protein FliK [Deltaproteobacteria bacterium]
MQTTQTHPLIARILPFLTVSPADIKLAELTDGEILKTDVKEILNNNKVKLFLKGILTEANTNVTLKAGESINAQVEIIRGKVILRVIRAPETNKIAEAIKMLLPEKADVGSPVEKIVALNLPEIDASLDIPPKTKELLSALKYFLSKIIPAEDKLNETAIKNIIEKGGQFYEAVIRKTVMPDIGKSSAGNNPVRQGSAEPPAAISAPVKHALDRLLKHDLKSILMNLIKELEGAQSNETEKNIHKACLDMLKNIELNQVINSMQAKDEDTAYFQIPVYFNDRLETAELFFFGGRKGGGGKANNGYGIVVSMDLQELGQVAADARIHEDTISIRIYAEKKESSEFIRSHLEILKNGIESKGMQISHIDCATGKKQAAKELFSRIAKRGLVDEFV